MPSPEAALTATPVELLERAIGYTRGTLATVSTDRLDRPTPCDRWTLGRLLDHMVDALDAFTEASSGLVSVSPTVATGSPVVLLREKACALLGAWTSPAAAWVRVADRALPAHQLLHAAALEITLHGWDVGQATGHGPRIPEELAAHLCCVAEQLLTEADRVSRFGPALPPAGPTYGDRLLGFSGRRPLQPHWSQPQPGVI
jgi:uncharacterized protein (TIGR03086 family)